MSRCTIDHSPEEVLKKLHEQQVFLPKELVANCEQFLGQIQEQETLNEVFHLLKKYDLATEEERMERNQDMKKLLVFTD